jgi:hypothetical protein
MRELVNYNYKEPQFLLYELFDGQVAKIRKRTVDCLLRTNSCFKRKVTLYSRMNAQG